MGDILGKMKGMKWMILYIETYLSFDKLLLNYIVCLLLLACVRTLAAILDWCGFLACHALCEWVLLHWVRGVGGISQNGGYFRHGIPVVGWWLVGWVLLCIGQLFSVQCQHLRCRISRILVLYFKCCFSCIDNGGPITGQLSVDVLPPEIWFKYWSWLWEWLVRYSNCESMHQVCEVCM